MCSLEEVLGEPSINPDLAARRDLIVGLHVLPVKQRDLLFQYHCLGLTEAELKTALGCAASTVHVRLERARQALARILEIPQSSVRGPFEVGMQTIAARLRDLGTVLIASVERNARPWIQGRLVW